MPSPRPLTRRALALALGAALAGLTRPASAQIAQGSGQSFTVPVGPLTQLTAISATGISGDAPDDITAYIYAYTPNGLGDGTATGPSLFTTDLGRGFTGFSLTPNITLVGGATYVVVLAGQLGVGGASAQSDTYAGGNAVNCFLATTVRLCSALNLVTTGADLDGFSVTFGPAAVTTPEPSTWALAGVGLLGTAGLVRGRNRAT